MVHWKNFIMRGFSLLGGVHYRRFHCSLFSFLLEFLSLLKGERVSHQQEEDEVMISGESSAQPSPPPPDSHLVTAELEGSTLTRAQYNTICSLTSSLLFIPTGDLVYDGHTLNPLTLHWHCTAIDYKKSVVFLSLLTEMAQEDIKTILLKTRDIKIPHLNVSNFYVVFFTLMSIMCRRFVFTMLLLMEIFTLSVLVWRQECQWIVSQ